MKKLVYFLSIAVLLLWSCSKDKGTNNTQTNTPTPFDNSSFSGTYTITGQTGSSSVKGKISSNGVITELIINGYDTLRCSGHVDSAGDFNVSGQAYNALIGGNESITFTGVISGPGTTYTGHGTWQSTAKSSTGTEYSYSGTWNITGSGTGPIGTNSSTPFDHSYFKGGMRVPGDTSTLTFSGRIDSNGVIVNFSDTILSGITVGSISGGVSQSGAMNVTVVQNYQTTTATLTITNLLIGSLSGTSSSYTGSGTFSMHLSAVGADTTLTGTWTLTGKNTPFDTVVPVPQIKPILWDSIQGKWYSSYTDQSMGFNMVLYINLKSDSTSELGMMNGTQEIPLVNTRYYIANGKMVILPPVVDTAEQNAIQIYFLSNLGAAFYADSIYLQGNQLHFVESNEWVFGRSLPPVSGGRISGTVSTVNGTFGQGMMLIGAVDPTTSNVGFMMLPSQGDYYLQGLQPGSYVLVAVYIPKSHAADFTTAHSLTDFPYSQLTTPVSITNASNETAINITIDLSVGLTKSTGGVRNSTAVFSILSRALNHRFPK